MNKTKDGREYVMEAVYRCKYKMNEDGLAKCSNCGWEDYIFNELSETPTSVMRYKYCPGCGAKITNAEFLEDFEAAFRNGYERR